tara:strand:+ start:1548 stop:3641 length:2094 start_codon:yes stop_codon:yes gene_type:complete
MNIATEIDDQELLATLENSINAADSYAESEIGQQRDKGHRYYYGQPLGNERAGRSQHVSMDVFDAVESVKSLMMDCFTADRNVCRFDPQTAEDFVPAKMATALTNYIFYRENKGSKILHDVIHDALVAKTGIVKRYYKDYYEYEEETFEGLDEASFSMLASDPAVTIMEIAEESIMAQVQDPQTGEPVAIQQTMYSGEIARKIDKSKVCVEVIPPEDFLITPRATDEEDADFCSHRTSRTRGELLSEGYDPEVVQKLDEDRDLHEDGSLGRSSIDSLRKDDSYESDNDREYVTIYESYLKKYRSDLKKCVYLKVLHSRRALLDVEMVSEKPFRYFTPFPLPHRFHGMSLADVLVDIQKTQSSLKRGVVDHTFMTNTSRFVANLSLVKNPRDLLDNRVGAVIDVNSPNPESVVRPMPMPNLSGTVFQAMESLETEKESRSGMSRMARGMDSTVVSKQNSSDLITQFMNASNRRIMVMCRNFAENFLKPLMFDLYKLAVENEKQDKLVQLDGQFVPVNPQFLGNRTEMTVAVALTPEEQAQEAQMLLSLDQQFTMNPQDPSLGGMYGASQRHAMLSRAFELLNIKSADMYLFNPNSPEFQQMQQQQQQAQQEAELKQQQQLEFNADITSRQVSVMEGQLELDVMKEQHKMVLDTYKQEHVEEEKDSRLLMDVEKQNHDMEMSEKELALEKVQNRNVSIG